MEEPHCPRKLTPRCPKPRQVYPRIGPRLNFFSSVFHSLFLFLVFHGQCGFPILHCLFGSDLAQTNCQNFGIFGGQNDNGCSGAAHLSAHLLLLGLQVSGRPEGHMGWEPSAQGATGAPPPGHTFSSLGNGLVGADIKR